MKAFRYQVKTACAGFGAAADGFAVHHPYAFMLAGLAGMPLILVAAVSLFTVLFALPLGTVMGWL